MIYHLKQKINNYLTALNNTLSPENIINLFFNKNALTSLLENIFNIIMLAERDLFVQNNPGEVKNGFHNKILNTKYDKLNLSITTTRSTNFRPVILPEKYKRTDDSL